MSGLLPMPPHLPPVCRRQDMSQCCQCRPADALGATAPYREASSGGVRGGGGGVAWGWGLGVGGRGWGLGGGLVFRAGALTPDTVTMPSPTGRTPRPCRSGAIAPGLSYPRRPSNRTLAGDKTGRVWGAGGV